jgi:hypothetical protein
MSKPKNLSLHRSIKSSILNLLKSIKIRQLKTGEILYFLMKPRLIGLELIGKNGAGKNQVLLFNQIMSSLLSNMKEDQ